MKKVENINNRPNQFIIYDDNGSEYFQSYKSIIAKKHNGNIDEGSIKPRG